MDPTLLGAIIGVGGTVIGTAISSFLSYYQTNFQKRREGKQALECLKGIMQDLLTSFGNAALLAQNNTPSISIIDATIPDYYIEKVALYNATRASTLLRISNLLASYQSGARFMSQAPMSNPNGYQVQWNAWWTNVLSKYNLLQQLINEL